MSRIGFSVGLKFSKKATERNKAKRLLREAARRHATELVNGYDIIIFFKHRPAKFDLGMLTGDIGRLLEKNKLLKKTRAADG